MYLFQSGGLAKRLVGKFSVELALSPPVSQAAAISQTAPWRLCPPLHCTAGRVVLFALHTNVTLALCYAGFLSFVLLEDNRILKQDEKDHLSCLADSKPLFVVASLTSCRQGKPTVSQWRPLRPRGWSCYTAVCSCVQLSGPTGCSFYFGVVHKRRRKDEVGRGTGNVNVMQIFSYFS